MNNITSPRQPMRGKVAIIILAALCAVIYPTYRIFNMVQYQWTPDITDILSLLLFTAQPVILLVYVAAFYEKQQAAALVPTLCGLMAAGHLYVYLANAYYLLTGLTEAYYTEIVLDILCVGLWIAALIIACRRSSNKVVLILAVAAEILMELYWYYVIVTNFVNICQYADWSTIAQEIISFLMQSIDIIGWLSFFAALLIFVIGNRIPALAAPKAATQPQPLTAEQALHQLNYQAQIGAITPEEYGARRAQILNQL